MKFLAHIFMMDLEEKFAMLAGNDEWVTQGKPILR